MGRAVVANDSLVVLTRMYLTTYAMNAPTQVLDRILLSSPLRTDNVYITDGAPKTIINVLENDSRLVDYKITAINRSKSAASVVSKFERVVSAALLTSASSRP